MTGVALLTPGLAQRLAEMSDAERRRPISLRPQRRYQAPADGSSDLAAIPALVTAKVGEAYTVDLYANGRGAPSTGTATLDVLQVHFADSVRTGTWLIAFPATLALISGD